jgi:hypothetical protein
MMSERDRPLEEEDIPRLDRENLDIGTGLGGGLAPVLPTDIDGAHPDSEWLSSSDQDTAMPNWTRADEVEPGLERMETPGEPLKVSRDTHIVAVFGEDVGKIDEVYGYAPSNEPAWASVRDGGRKILVPLMSGQVDEEGVHVPYPKALIEAAPALPDHELSVEDEMMLYSHYNERRILPPAPGDPNEHERTMHVLSRAA